jgi:hypothetical protein
MSSQQIPVTGLSSIVRDPKDLTRLEMLNVRHNDLAQFHSKFWGKSMKVEENEWFSTQTVEVRSEFEDPTDQNNDIIPGCYMLNIGIEGFAYPKIWVRAEYMRVFAHLQTFYDWPRAHNVAPSAVITGQPGIGRVLHRFLDYITKNFA